MAWRRGPTMKDILVDWAWPCIRSLGVALLGVFTAVEVPYEGGAWVNGQGLSFRIPGHGLSRRFRSVACGGAL